MVFAHEYEYYSVSDATKDLSQKRIYPRKIKSVTVEWNVRKFSVFKLPESFKSNAIYFRTLLCTMKFVDLQPDV